MVDEEKQDNLAQEKQTMQKSHIWQNKDKICTAKFADQVKRPFADLA